MAEQERSLDDILKNYQEQSKSEFQKKKFYNEGLINQGGKYYLPKIKASSGGMATPYLEEVNPDDYAEYRYEPNLERLGSLAKDTREALSAEIGRREMAAGQDLLKRRDEANTAIDAQLQKLLEESGVQGGIAREETGAGFSGRGLLRSTAASSAIEDITNQELQQKAGAQLDAFNKRSTVNQVINDSFTKLQQAKEQRAIRSTLAQIRQAEEFRVQANLSDIEQQYRSELANLDLERQEYEQNTALFGGILGGAAQILAFAL